MKLRIQILVDNPNSWVVPFSKQLQKELNRDGNKAELIDSHQLIKNGDILILLSCEKILKNAFLELHKHNLVVHASRLPKGKGMSPLTWQILEGEKIIFLTLFEAAAKLDSGVIYEQMQIKFEGHELIDEMRDILNEGTLNLMIDFMKDYPDVSGIEQEGEESFYPRRKPEDSRLDPAKTIEEQFNLLRIVDNERYPAFFKMFNQKYVLKIFKVE